MYDPASPLLRSATGADGLPQPDAKARFAEDRVLDAVLWCEILPGDTVTESDAIDRFGLSRAAARAALARLGYDGWAEPLARLGWRVLPVTGALIDQVLTARRLVEPMALSQANLNDSQRENIRGLGAVLDTVQHRDEPAAREAQRHFIDEVDSLLLSVIDPFTARHLRKLWHHSARITRYLEASAGGPLFHRDELSALVTAICEGDRAGVATARHRLIDAQEEFFLKQVLKNTSALGPGSGLKHRVQEAASNRRST